MDKKIPQTQNYIEYYANLTDPEFDGVFGSEDIVVSVTV